MNFTNYTKRIIHHTGNIFYFNDKDQFHRTDGPAQEFTNGNKYYYLNGLLHRTDGPALDYYCGDKYYYQYNKLHRAKGPAIILFALAVKSYVKFGKTHRLNAPAIISTTHHRFYHYGNLINTIDL